MKTSCSTLLGLKVLTLLTCVRFCWCYYYHRFAVMDLWIKSCSHASFWKRMKERIQKITF